MARPLPQRLAVGKEPSLTDLSKRIDALLNCLNTTFRLGRKDVLRRFGWSDSTLRRRIASGRFPEPVRDGSGHPYWTPELLASLNSGQ